MAQFEPSSLLHRAMLRCALERREGVGQGVLAGGLSAAGSSDGPDVVTEVELLGRKEVLLVEGGRELPHFLPVACCIHSEPRLHHFLSQQSASVRSTLYSRLTGGSASPQPAAG